MAKANSSGAQKISFGTKKKGRASKNPGPKVKAVKKKYRGQGR